MKGISSKLKLDMAEHDLQIFLQKIEQLNQLIALINNEPIKREELINCHHHNQVVALAKKWGFTINKRWGEIINSESLNKYNLFSNICPEENQEYSEILIQQTSFQLECIHSNASNNSLQEWTCQSECKWLLIVQGNLTLQIYSQVISYNLNVGDYFLIQKNCEYRVVRTDPAPGTIWLVLFGF